MSDYFSDVPQDNPHTDSIDWLYEKDITKGLFPGIYGPAAPVSRDQMASFLRRTVRLIDPALAERDGIERPVDPPTGLFIPNYQGNPILSHDGNPEVLGSMVFRDGETHDFENVLIRGNVRAYDGSVVNITDSELDGGEGPQCAAGWGGTINLTRCEVHNAEDGLKDSVNTVQVTVHRLYHRIGAHGDAHQLQSSGATAVHRFSYFDGFYSDGELANAAFMVKNDLGDGRSQALTVEDSYMNGGNYTVFLKDGPKGPASAGTFFRRVVWGGDSRYLNADGEPLAANSPAPGEWDVTVG